MSVPRYIALIPAAGVGERMGTSMPKQYAQLAGKPMLQHVMDTFSSSPLISHTFVVVSANDAYISDLPVAPRTTILKCGGATRQASVTNGLLAMSSETQDDDWILVHDAARPGLTHDLLDKLIAFVKDDAVGGLLALPMVDTIKRSDGHGRAEMTVERSALWSAQTPQMFRHAQLLQALQQAQQHAKQITDEASAIEAMGHRPKLVEGGARNFKVTLPQDLLLAELIFKDQGMS
jgi:2-C-methyl-D-erythritol 4-phosphate cytidylyltransferase